MTTKFRAGDVVRHGPTGEKWRLAAVTPEGDRVLPCGWPETLAEAGECELLKAATDEEHAAMVKGWLKPDAHASREVRYDYRRSLNRDLAVELGLAEHVQENCTHCGGSGKQTFWRLKPDVAVELLLKS